jgi:hypothetical protein
VVKFLNFPVVSQHLESKCRNPDYPAPGWAELLSRQGVEAVHWSAAASNENAYFAIGPKKKPKARGPLVSGFPVHYFL